ncbi:MAG: class I SAM-dependent methyltransferase [Nitrospiraceae bacterium]|nr:class I SAM-dependent methyltransferase [Nitrospiraceae bacterium]
MSKTEQIVCPCGSQAMPIGVFQTPTRRYVRCPSCELVFQNPRPLGIMVEEFYREDYDEAYGEVEASSDRHPVFESVARRLGLYRQPPGRLLDVGCGDGAFLSICQSAGWTCYGLELSKKAVARATRRDLTILSSDCLERAGECEPFDVITLVNILETVTNPANLLRQVAGALRPSGLVVIRATNGAFHLPMRTPARWVGSRYDQAFHLFLYSPLALRSLLKGVGLQTIAIHNSVPSRGPLTPANPWMSRLKWRIGATAFWSGAEMLYKVTGGRMVWAPSFELIAQREKELA